MRYCLQKSDLQQIPERVSDKIFWKTPETPDHDTWYHNNPDQSIPVKIATPFGNLWKRVPWQAFAPWAGSGVGLVVGEALLQAWAALSRPDLCSSWQPTSASGVAHNNHSAASNPSFCNSLEITTRDMDTVPSLSQYQVRTKGKVSEIFLGLHFTNTN